MFKLILITGDCEHGSESHRKTKKYLTGKEAAHAGYDLADEYDFKIVDLVTGKPVPASLFL